MKNIVIVNCYINTDQKEQILYECLLQLRKLECDILLVGNTPVTSQRVLDLCNHHIYTDDNFLLPKSQSPYIWYADGVECVNVYTKGIAYVITKKLNLSLNYANTLDYDNFVFMEFDNIFDDKDLVIVQDIFQRLTTKKAFFCKFGHNDNPVGYETIIFAGNVKFFVENVPLPNTYEKWVNTPPYSNGQIILEQMFPILLTNHMDKVEVVSTSIRNYFPHSQIDAFSFSKDIHIIENTENPLEPLLFIVGIGEQYKISIDGNIVDDVVIPKGQWKKYYFNIDNKTTNVSIIKGEEVVQYEVNTNTIAQHSSGIRYKI